VLIAVRTCLVVVRRRFIVAVCPPSIGMDG
jgi:hypothetical protein